MSSSFFLESIKVLWWGIDTIRFRKVLILSNWYCYFCHHLFLLVITAVWWSLQEQKHVATVASYGWEKIAKMIQNLLKPLRINERFVFWTLELYKKMHIIRQLWDGRPRSLPNNGNTICAWVYWNPLHEQKRLACEMNILA